MNQRPIGLQPIALPLSYSSFARSVCTVMLSHARMGICVHNESLRSDFLHLSPNPQYQKLPAIHQGGPLSEKLDVGSNSGSNARRRKADVAVCFWTQNSSECRVEGHGSYMPRVLVFLSWRRQTRLMSHASASESEVEHQVSFRQEDSQVEVITSQRHCAEGVCFCYLCAQIAYFPGDLCIVSLLSQATAPAAWKYTTLAE